MLYIFNKYGASVREVVVAGGFATIGQIKKSSHYAHIEAGIYEIVEVDEEGRMKLERALDTERELAYTLRTGLTKRARGQE